MLITNLDVISLNLCINYKKFIAKTREVNKIGGQTIKAF